MEKDEIRKILQKLQDRLYTSYTHMYLYYLKDIRDEETSNLDENLCPIEKTILKQEAEASRLRCTIILRSFFDSGENDCSLFNLLQRLVNNNYSVECLLNPIIDDYIKSIGKNKDRLKQRIIQTFLEIDAYRSYRKIKKFVDKSVAHNDLTEMPSISYNDIEKLSFRIEQLICKDIPIKLLNQQDSYDHQITQLTIKKYLVKIYGIS